MHAAQIQIFLHTLYFKIFMMLVFMYIVCVCYIFNIVIRAIHFSCHFCFSCISQQTICHSPHHCYLALFWTIESLIHGCLSQGLFLDFADLFQQVRPVYVRRSRVIVVSIVLGYGLDHLCFQSHYGRFSLLQNVKTGCGTNSAPYSMGTGLLPQ